MTILEKFGVTSVPVHKAPEPYIIRPVVPGRAVHIDADFLAYQVSYDKNNEKSIGEMRSNADVAIERIRAMSGAEHVRLHLTPHNSNKGGRYEAAIQREYQGNRKDRERPEMLHAVREWMHQERGATLCMDMEADDSMAIEQYKMLYAGTPELSIIATKDKDLGMVPGLQLNWDTGEISDTGADNFGWLDLITKVSSTGVKTKKVRGRGWKYFWLQMLTGDTADNIAGLPKVFDPRYIGKGKPKQCGPVMAYDILSEAKTNKDAFLTVRELYRQYGTEEGFTNFRTGTHARWQDVFVSEATLLWMRRNPDELDAFNWMREECL